ncbi:MAG: Ig-like domain repeat protein [Actinobacteria bacterium]|nr:Ig-like domain repeat protein [Actinomycetota bacterium]
MTADYSCADEGGSGLATCHGTVPSGSAIDTSAAGTYDFTVKATDGAGNRTSVTHSYKVFADTTAPAVDLETPPDLAWYLVGQTAYAKYSCADDGGSGLATCRGTVPSGSPIDTTLGPHSFTVTATDGAGNRTSVTHSYVVLAGVSGTILDASPKAGSALTLMIDLGQSAGALTPNGTVRGTVPRASTKHKTGPRAQTSMPTTQAASCGDPSVMLGSSQVADVRAMGYDGTGRLSLTWKTDRSWAGTCRALLVPIDAWGGATAAFVVRFA